MAVSSKSLSGLRGDLKISSSSEPRPALHLRLSPEALVAIRQGKGQLTFTDGTHPILRVGETEYKLSSTPESCPPEVYTHNRRTNTLELSGRLERRLLPDRTLDDSDVQERLKERNEQVLHAKEAQRIVSLDAASIHKSKGPSIQRSASSSPAPSKRGTPNTTAAATLGHKPRQPTRLVADHIPQRSQSAQGFHSDKPQYNYSIHAQRAPDKQPAVPAATAAPAGQIRHQQDPPAASVSDASSTSSYGDAASLFSSRVSTSSNTSVSSADSPPAKPEASAPASLTVNPAMIMMAPTQQTHPLPQKPRPSSVDVSSQGAAPSPPKAQSSTASSKPSGGLLKGKETVKKEKKRADSKYKSAEVVEDDDESDYEPTKNTGSGKRKAPSSGGSGSSASKSTNGAMSKKPKPLPAKAAMMERSGSNSSSSTGRESVSKAPKIESRTAGGARVCGKPTSKKTTPAVSAHSSPAPKPAPKASPSPAGSKKRKASGPTSLANKKSKRDFDYTSSEDEDAEGEDDDDETLQPAASDIASAPASRGRPDSIKRTHLSQSSAAAAAPRPRAPSQALTPGLSRANSFDHHSSTKSQVANPIQSPKEYASARAEYVKIFEDFGQRRKKMQTKQDILRRLLAGKDLDDSERIQIPSKREVTNMVTEVNEMQTQLASLKIRLWDFARSQQKQ